MTTHETNSSGERAGQRQVASWHSIGGGAYEERLGGADGKATGRYRERFGPKGNRTWRALDGVNGKKEARLKAQTRDPRTIGRRFSTVAETYLAAGCPGKDNVPKPQPFCDEETPRVRSLIKYFGTWALDKMTAADWHGYYQWRRDRVRKGCKGDRTVDKDRQTISNIFRYATANGIFTHNPFYKDCPRYYKSGDIRHTRDRAPETADTIHALAGNLLDRVSTEVVGWWVLFSMFTGCRISELLRLRLDAKQISERPARFEPGHIQTVPGKAENAAPRQFLQLGQRDKHGINPQVLIGNEFSEMMSAFHNWHRARFPKSPWYFPNETGDQPKARRIIGHKIEAACLELAIPKITPHGFRSFYVSKHRSDGLPDTVIANLIGDKTASLMQTTYGAIPDNWLGGEALQWLPRKGTACWTKWLNPEKLKNLGVIHNVTVKTPFIHNGFVRFQEVDCEG